MSPKRIVQIALFVSLWFASVLMVSAQPGINENLMEVVSLDKLGIELSPPAFWNAHVGQNQNFAAYTGPGEAGIFPGIKITFTVGENDLLESKANLSGSVRSSLMDKRMEKVTLVDEVFTSISGRNVLEQLFTCVQGAREVTAVAYHFNASGKQYTFLYFHGTSVFDKHLPMARDVFSSIFVPGEEQGVAGYLIYYGLMIICVLLGSYVAYSMSQTKALKHAGVQRLEVIRREEEHAEGTKDLDFDDWEDEGGDIQGGKFNIVDIPIDKQEEP